MMTLAQQASLPRGRPQSSRTAVDGCLLDGTREARDFGPGLLTPLQPLPEFFPWSRWLAGRCSLGIVLQIKDICSRDYSSHNALCLVQEDDACNLSPALDEYRDSLRKERVSPQCQITVVRYRLHHTDTMQIVLALSDLFNQEKSLKEGITQPNPGLTAKAQLKQTQMQLKRQ